MLAGGFSAYLDEIYNYTGRRIGVDLSKPEVFVGAMIGAMLVFLFASLAIKAVGEAAQTVISEVRRQFKEKPGIMKGTDTPDYGQCVDIVTIGALKQMIVPGILATAGPVDYALAAAFRATGVPTEVVGDARAAERLEGAFRDAAELAVRT